MKQRSFFLFKTVGISVLIIGALLIGFTHCYIQYRIVDMPGNTYAEISEDNQSTMSTANRLKRHVEVLANEIGGRSIYNTTERC